MNSFDKDRAIRKLLYELDNVKAELREIISVCSDAYCHSTEYTANTVKNIAKRSIDSMYCTVETIKQQIREL